MDSRFTFDDVRSSAPKSVGAANRIAKLTASVARLKAQREVVAEIKPSDVGKFDHKISARERLLKQLTSGPASPRRK